MLHRSPDHINARQNGTLNSSVGSIPIIERVKVVDIIRIRSDGDSVRGCSSEGVHVRLRITLVKIAQHSSVEDSMGLGVGATLELHALVQVLRLVGILPVPCEPEIDAIIRRVHPNLGPFAINRIEWFKRNHWRT